MKINVKIVAIAIAMMASINPAQAQDIRELLSDRSSERVDSLRKEINDREFYSTVNRRGLFLDHVEVYDGNSQEPVDLVSKYQASQGFSMGAVVSGSYFAGDFLPHVGAGIQYGYRRLTARAEFTLGTGEYDTSSDRPNQKFLEENFRAELQWEAISWANHHSQLGLLVGLSHKLRKDYHDLSKLDESSIDGYVLYNGRTIGGYAGVVYTQSPRFSSWSWFIKATAGVNQNYKGNIKGQVVSDEMSSLTIGGTKMYPEVCISIGANLNVFNKKTYNKKAMRTLNYDKKAVMSLGKGL